VFDRPTVAKNLRSESRNPPLVVNRAFDRPTVPYVTNADSVTPRCLALCMASNAESEEERAERLRQRRKADRLRRQRETNAERDARFVRNSVLAVLY